MEDDLKVSDSSIPNSTSLSPVIVGHQPFPCYLGGTITTMVYTTVVDGSKGVIEWTLPTDFSTFPVLDVSSPVTTCTSRIRDGPATLHHLPMWTNSAQNARYNVRSPAGRVQTTHRR